MLKTCPEKPIKGLRNKPKKTTRASSIILLLGHQIMDESLEKFKKKLLLPFPMKGVERKIYSCIILFFLFGVAWSIKENSWIYIDKSGSAIVIVGIWVTFRDFSNTASKYIEVKKKELENLIRRYKEVSPKGLLASVMHNGEIEDLENVQNDFASLNKLFIKRLRVTEATILIFGTLLNGYGSVLFQLIYPLN